LEPKGIDCPNPMVGFPRLQAREEVKPYLYPSIMSSRCRPTASESYDAGDTRSET
jgi:hypothetical protein